MMNRRTLIALLGAVPIFVGFRSCSEQQNALAQLTQTLGNAVASLVQVMGDTTAAERLRDHTAKAVALISAWQVGMSPRDVIHALNQLIDDLTSINVIERYRPLVVFVLGTIAAIIETIRQQSNNQGDQPHTTVRLTQPPHNAEEFRHTWDAIRAGSPGMSDVPVL